MSDFLVQLLNIEAESKAVRTRRCVCLCSYRDDVFRSEFGEFRFRHVFWQRVNKSTESIQRHGVTLRGQSSKMFNLSHIVLLHSQEQDQVAGAKYLVHFNSYHISLGLGVNFGVQSRLHGEITRHLLHLCFFISWRTHRNRENFRRGLRFLHQRHVIRQKKNAKRLKSEKFILLYLYGRWSKVGRAS